MAEPFTITAANFEAEVLKSTTPVLVDFWAPWCGPCRIVAPSVEEMATQYAGKLKVGKLNVDEHRQWPSAITLPVSRRCSSLRVAQWSIPWSAQCQRAPCKKKWTRSSATRNCGRIRDQCTTRPAGVCTST